MINNKLDVTTVKPTDSIDFVVRKMADESRNTRFPGFAVVIKNKLVQGVVTDGDIRRAYANNINFTKSISKIMSSNPITISNDIPEENIVKKVLHLVEQDPKLISESVPTVVITDKKNHFVDVIDFLELLQGEKKTGQKVAVFGMGYVGVTLAVSLANRGHQVIGIDVNLDLTKQLSDGKTHVHEPRLDDMLRTNLEAKKIHFNDKLKASSDIYIIAVGTPLDDNRKPSLSALNKVLSSIAKKLKKGDQVMLRSTVPVGTTNAIVVPYLENHTKLKAGKDFFVSFAPERTIEGLAMFELKTLPQVIGGYSDNCLKNSAEFWSSLTPNVIQVNGLEASELVKLANNTFRDLSFAFANELALLADQFNVNAFQLISAANDGYPRNPIPLPSPGVGGYCLTKDPFLFSSTSNGFRKNAVLGLASRKVNEEAAMYPIDLLYRFALSNKIMIHRLKILIIGVAFKGIPETKDTRGSVAIDILQLLESKVLKVYGWDAIINSKSIAELGFHIVDNLEDAIEEVDAILILNNHPDNSLSALLVESHKPKLIFDGWNQYDQREVEKINGLCYATMGYITHSSV